MPSDVREALSKGLDEAEWSWIKPHADRGRVILVTDDLTLLDVAESVAKDEVKRIEAWISSGQLAKPTPAQLSSWDETPQRKFLCVVVDPYVLIQNPRTFH